MRLIDLKSNEVFIFKGNDSYSYLKVDTGYVDVITEEYWKSDYDSYDVEVIKVDRSLIWMQGLRNDVPRYIIEERITKALELYKGQVDIQSRTEYLFRCSNCKKENRKSINLSKAKDKLCRKCKSFKDQTKGMIPLFEQREGVI